MKKSSLLLGFAAFVILIAGCTQPPQKPAADSCSVDTECACGTNIDTGACFYGNKAYVNVEKQCPDYCTGIAGNLETKCVEKKCVQSNKRTACTSDSDCVPEQCCHPTTCMNREFKTPCNLLCTQVCEGPIDCGAGSCACIDGKCGVSSTTQSK